MSNVQNFVRLVIMKVTYLFTIFLLITASAHAQATINERDSIGMDLKSYLVKNIKYPAISIKDYVEGSMVVTFQLNEDKTIGEIKFVRHLTKECDSVVVNALEKYKKKLSLPYTHGTIGFYFFLLTDGERDSPPSHFNSKLFNNFLFEINIIDDFSPAPRILIER